MSKNYIRIAQVLEYISEHVKDQPDLEKIARYFNLSPFHLQRIFSEWVGLSPKRFLQFLTINYAKKLLEDSQSVLDSTYETGLSGPGRMHDLFITLEAVTPGEFKNKGMGVEIYYGVHESPFGYVLLAMNNRGICGLSFHDSTDIQDGLKLLQKRWRNSKLIERPDYTKNTALRIFFINSGDKETEIRVIVNGTDFQIKVWEALLRIPEGRVCSYHDIAKSIGLPNANRAVGNAVGANPISYLIPCHRVIKNMGIFGNYQWGEIRKKAILGWEFAKNAEGSAIVY